MPLFPSIIVLWDAIAVVAGFGDPGVKELVMFYNAYIMDCKMNGNRPASIAPHCAEFFSLDRPYNFNEFLYFVGSRPGPKAGSIKVKPIVKDHAFPSPVHVDDAAAKTIIQEGLAGNVNRERLLVSSSRKATNLGPEQYSQFLGRIGDFIVSKRSQADPEDWKSAVKTIESVQELHMQATFARMTYVFRQLGLKIVTRSYTLPDISKKQYEDLDVDSMAKDLAKGKSPLRLSLVSSLKESKPDLAATLELSGEIEVKDTQKAIQTVIRKESDDGHLSIIKALKERLHIVDSAGGLSRRSDVCHTEERFGIYAEEEAAEAATSSSSPASPPEPKTPTTGELVQLSEKLAREEFTALTAKYGVRALEKHSEKLAVPELYTRFMGHAKLPSSSAAASALLHHTYKTGKGAMAVAELGLHIRDVVDVFSNDTGAMDWAAVVTSIIPFVGCGVQAEADREHDDFDWIKTGPCVIEDAILLTPLWPMVVVAEAFRLFMDMNLRQFDMNWVQHHRDKAWEAQVNASHAYIHSADFTAVVEAQFLLGATAAAFAASHATARLKASVEMLPVADRPHVVSEVAARHLQVLNRTCIDVAQIMAKLQMDITAAVTKSLAERFPQFNKHFIAKYEADRSADAAVGVAMGPIPSWQLLSGFEEAVVHRLKATHPPQRLLHQVKADATAISGHVLSRLFNHTGCI